MAAAVEFSFLLGLATLSAATALDLAKDGPTLVADYGWRTPVAGALMAFLTAVVAVRWLVTFLPRPTPQRVRLVPPRHRRRDRRADPHRRPLRPAVSASGHPTRIDSRPSVPWNQR